MKKISLNTNSHTSFKDIIGKLKYLDFVFDISTSEVKAQELFSHNLLHFCAFNNKIITNEAKLMFDRVRLIYNPEKPDDFILTMTPNYSFDYRDFSLTDHRSIKLRGDKLLIPGLQLKGPCDLFGSFNEIFFNFDEKNFKTEDFACSFLGSKKAYIKSIYSNNFSENIFIEKLEIHNDDDNYLIVDEVEYDRVSDIANVKEINIYLSKGVIINCHNGYINRVDSKLYLETMEIYMQDELFFIISKGYVDLETGKLYLGEGETNVT